MPTVRPLTENFEFRRGDSWPPWSFNVKDQDGNIASLAGATILMQVKKEASSSTSIKTFTEQNGFLVGNDVATMDWQTIVNNLKVGDYVYDIQITLSNGMVRTIFEGKITIKPDVSR